MLQSQYYSFLEWKCFNTGLLEAYPLPWAMAGHLAKLNYPDLDEG